MTDDLHDGPAVGTGWLIALMAAAMVGLAAAVAITAVVQQRAAQDAVTQSAAAQRMLIAMLDQETGLRGYGLNGRIEFLEPYTRGREQFSGALRDARDGAEGDPAALQSIRAQAQVARQWQALAEQARENPAEGFGLSGARGRKTVMDEFRTANTAYAQLVDTRRIDRERRLAFFSALIVLGMGAVFAAVGSSILRRQRRQHAERRLAERRYAARQRDLGVGLQVARTEEEAHDTLRRHLELVVPESEAVVLVRNNSANRLQPGTALPADSPLTDRLPDAEPRDCLAIRLAAPRREGAGVQDSVLRCDLCGADDRAADCTPLVVGGEVIGAALVGHQSALTARQATAVEESVSQAAPVLANLRNLALAESRAATDGLTGLPNRRAFDEALRRMAAQAGRTQTPLAALALDLDHFKQINDTYGHEQGDEVLAAMGALLRDVIRASDMAARTGGEEFVVLAPDTGPEGAVALAQTIRSAVREMALPGLPALTVSIGVAALPDDATTPAGLVRAADRLLYVAKERGRDRVEAMAKVPETGRREEERPELPS